MVFPIKVHSDWSRGISIIKSKTTTTTTTTLFALHYKLIQLFNAIIYIIPTTAYSMWLAIGLRGVRLGITVSCHFDVIGSLEGPLHIDVF